MAFDLALLGALALAIVLVIAFGSARSRRQTVQRASRIARSTAKQKAWNMVYGRFRHRRLSYRPDEPLP